MRIAFVTAEFFSEKNRFDGGLAIYLFKMCKGLIKAGHEPLVFQKAERSRIDYFEGIEVISINPPENNLFKFLDIITRFRCQGLLKAIWTSYYINKEIKKVNKSRKIDIIQFANLRGLAFFRPGRIPSVIRASSYTPLWNEADGIKKETFFERQIEWFEDISIKRMKHVFAPSYYIANVLSKKFRKKVNVIESPFVEEDEKLFSDQELKKVQAITKGKRFFLFFGSLGLWKGVTELAEAIKMFNSFRDDYFFVLIGKPKGNQGRKILSELFGENNPNFEKMFHLPAMPHNKLYPIIDKAWAVVLPSRVENLSNACIEAMSRGKIVLGTDGVSFEQLITDGKNGFLFKKMNVDSLFDKLSQIADIPLIKKEEIEKNAMVTVKRLELNRVINNHFSFYQKVIESN